jgi:CRP-like cAMP-binding protein
MHQLFLLLQSIYPMSEGLIQHLSKAFEYCKVAKREHLLREGQVCRYMYFIDRGLVRCFHHRGNKEIVTWFYTEGSMVLSYESFYDQVPSKEYIEALEECEIYRIPYTELQYIYRAYLEANVLRAELTERYYRTLWKCFDYTRFTTANERYQFFIDNFPQWVNRVPEKDIAAFLGVTASHFSRSKR